MIPSHQYKTAEEAVKKKVTQDEVVVEEETKGEYGLRLDDPTAKMIGMEVIEKVTTDHWQL